jgi:hypothetical protein
MDTQVNEQSHPGPGQHPVMVTVNTKDVRLQGPRTTGSEIKAAAIAQGVAIEQDFVLSEVLPNGRTKIIGDTDRVTVHPGSTFVAVAPDDNS